MCQMRLMFLISVGPLLKELPLALVVRCTTWQRIRCTLPQRLWLASICSCSKQLKCLPKWPVLAFSTFLTRKRLNVSGMNFYHRSRKLSQLLLTKNLQLRDGVKGATAIATGWYAQSMLLGGLNKFYTGAKTKAVDFWRKNPNATPEQYMATGEGEILKGVNKIVEDGSNAIDNAAHNASYFEKLKSSLQIEEFTSIIPVTKHGVQRLIERNFSPQEVSTLVKFPDISKIQSDGAKVFIKQIGEDKYNVIICCFESGAVVTALKNTCKAKLMKMGRNHGWEL